MRNRRLILFAALATAWLLFACDTGVTPPAPSGSTAVPPGPTTGQLLGERSQVFYAAGGGSKQSVQPNQSVTVGNGDEAWTEQQGRALLKFSDLWLRLYDDTTLRATDVTPSSLKMALGQGAALTGAVPGVYDRIDITTGDPPHARIILAGTVVMIAHVPDRRITLARSFDGVLRVESAQTDAGTEVRPSEWAIVWGDNEVELTQDEDMIRELVVQLGLWDLFHDIEVDAGGFGPPGATVPMGRVPQVFVKGGETECPPPEVGLRLASVRGTQVNLTGRAIGGCPDAGIHAVTFDWDDGSGDELSLDGGREQTFKFSHNYRQPGDYFVVVTAYDTLDQTGEGELPVTIEGSATECPPPEVGLKLASQSGNQIMVTGQAVGGCPEAGIRVATFDWGDGSGDELSLDGGQKQSFRFQHKYAQPGDYRVVVTAYDTLDQTGEGELPVTIEGATPSAAPNLRAQIVSAPEQANCGQDLGDSVQIEVANVSDADAGGFFVGLYLSQDAEGSSRELLKGGREYVEGLAAGDSLFVPMVGSNQIPTSVPEGTNDYWLVAVADDANQIEESNENDNLGTWRIRIGCLK